MDSFSQEAITTKEAIRAVLATAEVKGQIQRGYDGVSETLCEIVLLLTVE